MKYVRFIPKRGKTMVDIKKITDHCQDSMLFDCDNCGNTINIDTYDLLKAEDNVHCLICGAGGDHLTLVEEDTSDAN